MSFRLFVIINNMVFPIVQRSEESLILNYG